jgi:diacylglycerol kinase (ATP)
MAEHGLGDELFASESEAEATERVDAAIGSGYDVVVAAGGDGTVGSVARRLLDSPTALGILPLGSAMNVARSVGIPRDLEAAATIIAGGVVRAIDVGEAKGVVFFEAASIGMNAAVLGEAQRVDEGRWVSLLAMVRVGLRYPAHRIDLDLDGRRVRVRALTLAIANGPYTGLGLTLAPDAQLDDGRFDVVVFEGLSRWGLALHLARIVGGRKARATGMRRTRAACVRVSGRHPIQVRADASDLGRTPIEFVVRPGALRVLVPAPGTAASSDGALTSAGGRYPATDERAALLRSTPPRS